MRYSINDISRLITEDPDVFVESSLYGIDDRSFDIVMFSK